jgi:hypothetical protein
MELMCPYCANDSVEWYDMADTRDWMCRHCLRRWVIVLTTHPADPHGYLPCLLEKGPAHAASD